MKIKLVGRYNDLELGTVDDQHIFTPTGLLADRDHCWKILEWINQGLEAGETIEVVKSKN